MNAPTRIASLSLIALVCSSSACRREQQATPPAANEAPNGVARWHLTDPAERVKDGAILVDPPALGRRLVPAVPTMLRRAVDECARHAPTRGEERVEVHFDVQRDQRISGGRSVLGGALAECVVEKLSRATVDSQGEPARIIARLVVSAPGQAGPAR
jgi:hypothetical protein